VQAWDRYAYVNNSPTNYADPNGHKIICGVSRGSCGSSTQSAQTIPLGEDPSKQFGAYPSLPSNTTLQSPFYDKNAEINGSFRGSIIMNFPRFTSEPSYDYDPMGNQITLPYGNWAVFGLQLIQLVGEWALPYTPPETSTVDLNLYYSLYHDGSIQFPGMSVSNNSNEIVYVATLDTITTNNRPPLWPTIVDTTRIVSPVYPGQSSIIPINSNNRFPSGYIVTNRVNINVYRYDGRLYYYKNLP
jgi:hypothetical protein